MFFDSRQVQVLSALGPGFFQLRSLEGREKLSGLFRYQVELRCHFANVLPADILGTPMTIELELAAGRVRQFSGLVAQFEKIEAKGRYAAYRVTLVPSLFFLSLTRDCRISQGDDVPSVVTKILKDADLSPPKLVLGAEYPHLEYLVQFRESKLAFIERILHEAGAHFFFTHEKSDHTMNVADSLTSFHEVPGYEEVPFYPPTTGGQRDKEHITSWETRYNARPGAAALADFDWGYGIPDLNVTKTATQPHAMAHFEVFDYPGRYNNLEDGRVAAAIELERLRSDYETYTLKTDARGIGVGCKFRVPNLADEPGHADLSPGQMFAVVEAHFQINSDSLESAGGQDSEMTYAATLTVVKEEHPFHPGTTTKRPRMAGPQSAIVTGPKGHEIHVDELGRVRVQFHWDRHVVPNTNTSCYVRVSQPWAGNGFGFVQIPRIGEEVLVDFLDGDPDRPVIVGRLYNGKNKPPYKLADNATQSGLKTRSSPGGHADNFNELRFEDRKGREEVYLQAERDHTVLVKHDETIKVMNNRSTTVDQNDHTEVGGTSYEHIVKDAEFVADQKLTETIHGDAVFSVDGKRVHTVGKDESLEVVGRQAEVVGKGQTLSVKDGGQQVDIKGGMQLKLTGDRHITVSGSDTIDVGKGMQITVADQLLIKCGDSSLLLKKNGDVVISGKNVVFKSEGAMTAKASKDLILSGSNILKN